MRRTRWVSVEACLIVLLSGITVLLSIARYFVGPKPFLGVWDDALMLPRYAHFFLLTGKMEWNPGGQPVYGLTSPYFFLAIVSPVAKFLSHNPLAIPMIASMISGCLFFIALAFTLRFLLPGSVLFRYVAIAVIALSFARNATDISIHFESGMDTFFAMFYFTVFIALARWHAIAPRWISALAAGVWGGLAFGARPDLLAFTMLVPLAWLVLGQSRRIRLLGAAMLAAGVAVLALELSLAAIYFHSPLPLPFYAKSLQLYPGLTTFRYTGLVHFTGFVLSYWFLFVVILLDVAVDVRAWWRETSPLIKALAAGVIIHMGYFLVGVTQIMPAAHRFYYPALPAVVFLAACAIVRLLNRLPEAALPSLFEWRRPYRYAAFAAVLVILPPPHPGDLDVFGALLHHQTPSFNLTEEYRAYLPNYWFGLDRFSALPSDLTMATTEIGHVGAMNLDKTVVDLAGLNEPLFAHHRFSAAVLFAHYHPDLIYMPHPDYRAMNESLAGDPTFRRDYELFPARSIGVDWMGVALSRSSPHYAEMRRIVSQVCAEHRNDVPCALDSHPL